MGHSKQRRNDFRLTFVASGWYTMFCWTKIPTPRRRRAMARKIPFAVAPQTASAQSHTGLQGTSTTTKTRSPLQCPPRHEAVKEAPRAQESVYRYTVRNRVAVVEETISRPGQISTGLVPVRDGVASYRRYRRIRNVSQTVIDTSQYQHIFLACLMIKCPANSFIRSKYSGGY